MIQVDEKLTDLIGFSRVAFDDAQAAQAMSSRMQWGLAAIAILTSFSSNHLIALISAGLAFIGALVIAYFGWLQNRKRRFGDRVRRATLLAKGLGHKLSTHEFRSIEADFEGDKARARQKADPGYYASELEPGEDRLIENLYESAFWSCDLYRHSARKSWFRFSVLIVAVIFVAAMTLPFLVGNQAVFGSRLFLVLMTLLVSREAIGDAIAYSMAHQETASVMERLNALKSKSDKTPDLMLILGDYNSAVETAPMPQSGVYEARHKAITEAWNVNSGATD